MSDKKARLLKNKSTAMTKEEKLINRIKYELEIYNQGNQDAYSTVESIEFSVKHYDTLPATNRVK